MPEFSRVKVGFEFELLSKGYVRVWVTVSLVGGYIYERYIKGEVHIRRGTYLQGCVTWDQGG